ncbi:MAG: hypothetical protein QW579_07020 [Desulfurococcaceae archaeon]
MRTPYGLTIYAERSAVSVMVACDDRKPVLAVTVADTDELVSSCGACRGSPRVKPRG